MRSHAKASSAGSTQRQAGRLGRIFRGADAGRAPSPRAAGSGALAHGPVRSGRLALLCLPALLLAAVFVPSAQAAPTTIAEFGEGAGKVDNPVGTAVHQATGDLYVADRNNFRVSKFDSEGGFLLAFSYGVADGQTHEQGPVYLRSSNHKLPDLVFDLHGLVDVEVQTRIDSVRGGIRARVENAPDAPISRVILNIQGGKKGLIVNSRSLCTKRKARANARGTGQNGKQFTRHPVLRPQCGKRRKAKRSSHSRVSQVARASAMG